MTEVTKYIPYRLSNIFHGGKHAGETAWINVPKLFPNSLGHRYTIEYGGKPIPGRVHTWRCNTDVICKIIKIYENEIEPSHPIETPPDDTVIIHLRLGDVIEQNESKDTHEFKYKDVSIHVKKTHVHLISHFQKK